MSLTLGLVLIALVVCLGGATVTPLPPIFYINTIAGNGSTSAPTFPGNGSPATSAILPLPQSVVDENGDVIITSMAQNAVFTVNVANGTIYALAGSGRAGFAGDGGPATLALLNGPSKGRIRPSDSAFVVVDTLHNNRIRIIKNGVIETLAGNGQYGFKDSDDPLQAEFRCPNDIAFDATGAMLIVDSENHRIRRMSATGAVTTVAGTGQMGYNGDGIAAVIANLFYPCGVAVAADGVSFYIADRDNDRVRFVDVTTGLMSTVAGTGVKGYDREGLPATSSPLSGPWGIATDNANNANPLVYITEATGNRVRVFSVDGKIWTVCGTGVSGYNGDGIPALAAQISSPIGLEIVYDRPNATSPTLYLADAQNGRVRQLTTTRPTS